MVLLLIIIILLILQLLILLNPSSSNTNNNSNNSNNNNKKSEYASCFAILHFFEQSSSKNQNNVSIALQLVDGVIPNTEINYSNTGCVELIDLHTLSNEQSQKQSKEFLETMATKFLLSKGDDKSSSIYDCMFVRVDSDIPGIIFIY